jgi:hypothetical protein
MANERKTPGQVCFEAFFKGHPYSASWTMSQNKEYWEEAAKAVLAAHGEQAALVGKSATRRPK